MNIRILLSFFYFLSITGMSQQPVAPAFTTEQQAWVSRKTWRCFCYSRCFTRLCERWFATTPVISMNEGKERSPVITRASHPDLRKRGSSNAAHFSPSTSLAASPQQSPVPPLNLDAIPGLLNTQHN